MKGSKQALYNLYTIGQFFDIAWHIESQRRVITQKIRLPIETASPINPSRQKCCVPTLRYLGNPLNHSKKPHQPNPPTTNNSVLIMVSVTINSLSYDRLNYSNNQLS
jgi:hypothetical protein